MAMQICNNDGNNAHVFGHKSKGFFYQSFFRGRKPACRTKAATGIPIKKQQPLPLPPPPINIITSLNIQHNKRKLDSDSESCCERTSDDLKRSSKRVCTPTAAAYSDYEGLGMVGKGSYGVVYKVRHKQTGQIMAMKEETDGSSPTALMEIDILKTLPHHPSIVGFYGVIADEYGGSFLVMEYMDTDLRTYIALKNNNKEERIAMNQVKELMKQLLEGVNFLHQNGLMHRDLKPENILINSNGDLKICDFGLSIWFGEEKGSYSPHVGTLWYRAPELLLDGVEEYSSEVDMWSVGCIMAELVLNKVLFKGKDEEDQLHQIYCILGHSKNSSKINSSISSANLVLSEDGFDLLKGLLTYDTTKRMTAESALNHVWFHDED